MSKEIWKPVKGFERFYQVSNMGRVRSLKLLTKPEARREFFDLCAGAEQRGA